MNRTNSKFSVKNLVLGALFLALALVLPFFTGQIPQIGTMLCPMHLPILLAGFVCGGPVGAVVGFIAPLLRMVMFGMPPFYVAIAMAFELLTYGLVSGIMYRKVFKKQTVGTLYGSLLTAMVAGRVVWGIVKVILSGIAADAGAFTFAAFISGALLNAIPGIVVQLILVPAVVVALQHYGFPERAALPPFFHAQSLHSPRHRAMIIPKRRKAGWGKDYVYGCVRQNLV